MTNYTIKDSGDRRQFSTGAVRDITSGKGRCDLLPLDIVEDLISFSDVAKESISLSDVHGFLSSILNFIVEKDPTYLYIAAFKFCEERDWDIYTAVLEVSIHYEQGALKYGERNWEHGIPLHSYVDSCTRHYLKWKRGDCDEPHDRAVIWNILGALWTLTHKPKLDDIDNSVFTEEDAK